MEGGKNSLLCSICSKPAENKKLLRRHARIAHKREQNKLNLDKSLKRKTEYCENFKFVKSDSSMNDTFDHSKMPSSLFESKLNPQSLNRKQQRSSDIQWGQKRTTKLEEKLQSLKAVLNDKFCLYLHKLRFLCTGHLTKVEFDGEVRKYFPLHMISAHDEFFYEFLRTIRSISPFLHSVGDECSYNALLNNVPESNEMEEGSNFRDGFVEEETFFGDNAKEISSNSHNCESESQSIHTKSRHIQKKIPSVGHNEPLPKPACLPDVETTYALMLISAWECNLELVDVAAVPIMKHSLELYIQRILMAVMLRKNYFKLKDGVFIYDIAKEKYPCSKRLQHENYVPSFSVNNLAINMKDIVDVLKVHSSITPLECLRNLALEKAISKFSSSNVPL